MRRAFRRYFPSRRRRGAAAGRRPDGRRTSFRRFEQLEPRLLLHGDSGPHDHQPDYDPNSTFHIHARLSIVDEGQPVTIPAEVGNAAFIHTHDTSGELHIHPATPPGRFLTLGDFFDTWSNNPGTGSPSPIVLTDTQLFDNQVDANHALQLTVNGVQIPDNYAGYQIHDDDELRLEFLALNAPPTANPDQFGGPGSPLQILEDSVDVVLDVLANDSSAPDVGEIISIVPGGFSQPANGMVSLSGDGSTFLYTPDADFFGDDSFTYTITDDDATNPQTASTSVSLTVTGTNDPPTATADSERVTENTSNNRLDLLANDSIAPDRDETLTITGVAGVSQGVTVDIEADGRSVLYTPRPGFRGTDTFSYTISDGNGGTDSATVTVQVTAFVPGSLSGFVYIDANNNGLREAGERVLEGVTITLTGTSIFGAVNRTTQTLADGSYSFLDLAPNSPGASYLLTETQPPQDLDGDGVPILDGKDTIGSQGGSVANDRFTIVLAEGVNGVDNNFGEVKGRSVTVVVGSSASDYLVRLSGTNGLDYQESQSTELTGRARFAGLLPGTYRAEIGGPFLIGNQNDVTLGGADATLNFAEPTIHPMFPTYLDSVSSRSAQFAQLAAGPDGQHWRTLGPGWEGTTNLQANLSADGSTISLTIADGSGSFQGALPATSPRIRMLNRLPDGTARLRLEGNKAAFVALLQPVAGQASNNGAGGEGEAPAVFTPVAAPVAPVTSLPLFRPRTAAVSAAPPTSARQPLSHLTPPRSAPAADPAPATTPIVYHPPFSPPSAPAAGSALPLATTGEDTLPPAVAQPHAAVFAAAAQSYDFAEPLEISDQQPDESDEVLDTIFAADDLETLWQPGW